MRFHVLSVTQEPLRIDQICWALYHISVSFLMARINPLDGFISVERFNLFLGVVGRYAAEPNLLVLLPYQFFYYMFHYALGRFGRFHPFETFSAIVTQVAEDIQEGRNTNLVLSPVPKFSPIIYPKMIWY